MSTLKQIEANRRNAQKSSGPRTDSGKSHSRLNALQTGIDAKLQVLPREDATAFDTLAAEYHDRHAPATPEQRALVDILVHNEWLLRRFRRVEHELWDVELRADHTHPFAFAFNRQSETFARLQRRIDSAQRQYHQAIRTLRQLQAREQTLADQSPDPEIGFVPSPSIPLSPNPGEAPIRLENSVPPRLLVQLPPPPPTPAPLDIGHHEQ